MDQDGAQVDEFYSFGGGEYEEEGGDDGEESGDEDGGDGLENKVFGADQGIDIEQCEEWGEFEGGFGGGGQEFEEGVEEEFGGD